MLTRSIGAPSIVVLVGYLVAMHLTVLHTTRAMLHVTVAGAVLGLFFAVGTYMTNDYDPESTTTDQ